MNLQIAGCAECCGISDIAVRDCWSWRAGSSPKSSVRKSLILKAFWMCLQQLHFFSYVQVTSSTWFMVFLAARTVGNFTYIFFWTGWNTLMNFCDLLVFRAICTFELYSHSSYLLSTLWMFTVTSVLLYYIKWFFCVFQRWEALPGEPPPIDDTDVDDWLPRFVVLHGKCIYFYLSSTGIPTSWLIIHVTSTGSQYHFFNTSG